MDIKLDEEGVRKRLKKGLLMIFFLQDSFGLTKDGMLDVLVAAMRGDLDTGMSVCEIFKPGEVKFGPVGDAEKDIALREGFISPDGADGANDQSDKGVTPVEEEVSKRPS